MGEEWLADAIHEIRVKRWKALNISADRKLVLQKRICKELLELMIERKESESESQGRTSGSLAWRLSRGETGKTFEQNVIKPTKNEIQSNHIHIQYSPSKDEYKRLSDNSKISGWKKMLFECENVFKKEEHDWKMVYLARNPGKSSGKVSWKFDLTDVKGTIKELNIKAHHKTFHNGQVTWSVSSEEDTRHVLGNFFIIKYTIHNLLGINTFFTPSAGIEDTNANEFSRGKNCVTLTALLSDGHGDTAWQHAQLFRSAITDDGVLFDVELIFEQ